MPVPMPHVPCHLPLSPLASPLSPLAYSLIYAVPAMTRRRPSHVLSAPTRRQFMGLSAAAIAAAAGARLAASQTRARQPQFAYVGSFTSEVRKARGEGISVYRIDSGSGRWGRVQALNREVNPGYLAIDPKRPVLYAVHSEPTRSRPSPSTRRRAN